MNPVGLTLSLTTAVNVLSGVFHQHVHHLSDTHEGESSFPHIRLFLPSISNLQAWDRPDGDHKERHPRCRRRGSLCCQEVSPSPLASHTGDNSAPFVLFMLIISLSGRCYWSFHGHFRREAEQLFQGLESSYQKALQTHLRSGDSMMSLPASDRSSSSSQESLK